MNTFDEYELANMNLGRKLEEENMTVTTILQKYRLVEGKLQILRTEKERFMRSLEDMTKNAANKTKVHSKTPGRILHNVEPQFTSVAMRVSK